VPGSIGAVNPDLQKLQPYPFERLAKLKAGATPPKELAHIAMSIGEPKHPAPPFVVDALIKNLDGLGVYPMARGIPELRESIARWCTRRFGLKPGALDPERHVLPVSGTREGLFAFAQAVVDRSRDALVLMPNPFYQIYEGAALLAGATPVYLACRAERGFVPDLESVPESIWKRCQLLYLCSPGNPTGAVLDLDHYERAIELSDRHGFVIASDECYSEIYRDETKPPLGILEACAKLGRDGFGNCIALQSLSKRSSLPGLRSGFVAGDAAIIERFALYRTYHGAAVPLPTQRASIAAWDDDAHVVANRAAYRAKFDAVLPILKPVLDTPVPDAAFYLWPRTPVDDERFCRELFAQQNLTALPGRYLSRPGAVDGGSDPGLGRVRISLVAPVAECVEAAQRIRRYVETL
jgi:N-succinyldiaminopimelate aminotransferase